ncbi:MAG: type II toxin-antitoxin system RelB/DinJ family antitoxin [Lachnospiraceae bacterium]|jgi:DNA-damage-inducible protein J|nr:type II toxin-antitoxin system RelB/DinJ family antitoxin [Lachnospiraceae bacterium]
MAKSDYIRARVDHELKENAESIFEMLGLSMSESITIFLKQCVLLKGLPFDVRIPNDETLRVFTETDYGENLIDYKDADDIFRSLGI